MIRRRRKYLAATLTAALGVQSISGPVFACGAANHRVVKTTPEFRNSALFAVAVETSTVTDHVMDLDGRPLKFIGNAFLIERTDDTPTATAYFATARHNIAAACRATQAGQPPKLRLVMHSLASYAVEGLSAADCDELRAIETAAGSEDIIFVPDVEIVRAQLPTGVGKPVMVGSLSVPINAGNGNVEQMSSQFAPISTGSVGLPDKPWQKPEHQKFSNVRAIGGNNLGGASGSPYVVSENGRPIVLGIVTNSIPPTGVPLQGADFTLTASETGQLFAAQFPEIAAQAFSLVFTPETLIDVYDTQSLDEKVAKPFALARSQSFSNSTALADDLAVRLNGAGLSSAVYLKRQCEKRPEIYADRIALAIFCSQVIDLTEDYQCYIDSRSYLASVNGWFAPGATSNQQAFATIGAAVKAINAARETFGSAERAGKAEELAPLVSEVLRTALGQAGDRANLVGPNWDSAVLFDLAKAERLSGVEDAAYLSRLSDALDVNPGNTLAKKAFVDGTVQAGVVEETEKSLKLLGELQAARAIPLAEAVRTRTLLQRMEF